VSLSPALWSLALAVLVVGLIWAMEAE